MKPKTDGTWISTGDKNMDYAGGDFLNSVSELVCYFAAVRDFDFLECAKHLKFYAEKIERDEK